VFDAECDKWTLPSLPHYQYTNPIIQRHTTYLSGNYAHVNDSHRELYAANKVKIDDAIIKKCKLTMDFKDEACAICLERLLDGKKIKPAHENMHYFHTDCIDKWNGTCPLCRK
jgi:hypothetical protein